MRRFWLAVVCLVMTACAGVNSQAGCVFSNPPSEELLIDRLGHLEIVDAETGEVAAYDTRGDPVLEGGQPLAIWAEFDIPTRVRVCVLEAGEGRDPSFNNEITFSDQVDTLLIGRYDIGTYRLLISIDGTLVKTLQFSVR